MNQQYLTQENFHAFLSPIIDDEDEELEEDEELVEYYYLFLERNTPYQDFFQDSTVMTRDKVKIMFMMSRDNLKFHQLENVDDNNHQQLHRLLIEMFSDTPTEDNELRMVHVLACIVNEKSDNVIANLIDTSATERQAIFMERIGDSEYTALHLACRYNASADIINALIAIGGRELLMMNSKYQGTALHLACCYNASVEITNALIAIGGRELVMMNSEYPITALHQACCYNVSIDTINALIAIGGRELVMMIDTDGHTALHYTCYDNAPVEITNALIAIGGRELVIMNSKYQGTALHLACCYDASVETINALIAIGGRELVMMIDTDGCTALHQACSNGNASVDTINALIAIGGRELVMMINNYGCTALHQACSGNASFDIIEALIDIGGKLLLTANDYEGKFPLVSSLLNCHQPDNRINKVSSLISSGIIQDQVGGEFGIGGLFNFASEEGQQRIFEHWNNNILPALEMNAALISRQPILQAAIISRAPPHIIQDIISRFDCIVTQDSRGRYPIVVAALHGLKWENGMEEVLVKSREEVGNADALTGLFPFMLAATGQSSDLSSIYELMLQSLDSF